MGKAEVLYILVLVLLQVSWIIPGGLGSVFKWIIELIDEKMANVIHFANQPSPWSFTVNLRDVHCSCIMGVVEPINETGE